MKRNIHAIFARKSPPFVFGWVLFDPICLSSLRYQKGAIAEPPSPFVRPTLDILVKHCTDEHPAVWEKLRNSPAQDLD